MCGIVSKFSYNRNDQVCQDEIVRIRDKMTSRGPDGSTLWVNKSGHKKINKFRSINEEFALDSKEIDTSLDFTELLQNLHNTLLDSVRHHLVADEPDREWMLQSELSDKHDRGLRGLAKHVYKNMRVAV